jgi:uncharacterized membrane protein
MKSLLAFIRHTLTGGILFLLPIVLIVIILQKAISLTAKLAAPLDPYLPDRFLGFDGRAFLVVAFLVLVCFAGGLLIRSARVKKSIGSLEENLLSYLPGYTMIKSLAADAVGEKEEHVLTPVLVQDGDAWNIGFLVEEAEGLSTVFFPEAPKNDSGEVKIVPAASVKKLDLPSNLLAKSLRAYGKGALEWVK